MSKTEYAWVIQRDDGKYVNFMDNEDLTWYEHIWQATMNWSKYQAEKDIVLWKLQNCRPVKVEIRVVGDSMDIDFLKETIRDNVYEYSIAELLDLIKFICDIIKEM